MGMAASQVRFLSLQNRKNTIGLNLMTLSNRRMALSRDMNRVSTEYNNAMNQRVLKWSNDSGVTYQNLNYDLLMKPNELNSNLPFILTDAQGRVVLDDNKIVLDGKDTGVTYRDLATMISAYSGVVNDETAYNNTKNLTDNTLTADQIKNIKNHPSGATSGLTNENGYKIVSTSTQMPQNSLRYDLMEKLGLISAGEKQEIKNQEIELYGAIDNINGPFKPDCLMGKYYLALAHYQAYQELLRNGEYTFAATEYVPASVATERSNDRSSIIIDNWGEITYHNNVSSGAGGANIQFNADLSYLKELDLTNATGGSLSETNNFLSYSTNNDGTIDYSYSVAPIITLMGFCNVTKNTSSTYEDYKQFVLVTNGTYTEMNNNSWADMYANDAVIQLYSVHDHGHDYKQTLAEENLEKLVQDMGRAFSEQKAVVIDSLAVSSAVQKTIEFFINNRQNKDYGANNHTSKIKNWANDKAKECNGIGSSTRKGSWIQGTDDYSVASISVRNLYNTFITFYDAYHHQNNGSTLITNSSYGGTSSSSTTETPTNPAELNIVETGTSTTFTYNEKEYKRVEGTYQEDPNDENSKFKAYNYYERVEDPTTHAITWNLVQQDITKDSNNTIIRKDVSSGNTYSKTQNSDDLKTVTTYGWNYLPPPSGGDNVAVQETNYNEYALSYTYQKYDPATQGYVTAIAQFKIQSKVENSNYSSVIDGDVTDYTKELLDKVTEATAAKDEALEELDKLFADKEAKIMDYFDALFKMISEKGWVYDSKVNDTSNKEDSANYLNAMLENNMYFITEVDTLDGTDFNYATKLVTNVSKIFQVYDTDAQNVALSKYEAEKADINTKEKQLDVRINKLEAEQDAIKTELESIKKVIDDNVSNTFKIFT